MSARILVVDDERLIRWSLKERLGAEGYLVREAHDLSAATRLLDAETFDLMLLDLHLPDGNGLTLLRNSSHLNADMPVVVITAFSSIDGAVEAMKAGAHDYITKPFNMDEMVIIVSRALENKRLRHRVAAQLTQEKRQFGIENIVGDSKPIQGVKQFIRKVAAVPSTAVLLLGESGTGKDLVARAIHYESSRADQPFINISCTALPETLLESEVFGHERGAFTDAHALKKGLFELADRGTVYLDEVGDMSPGLQAKFLRILEEKAFRRVGGAEDISVDVRVIAATNRDLDAAIESDTFREDLYYRLSAVPIYLPPLRDRREDISLLAAHFLEIYNQEFHTEFREIERSAIDKLCNYNWPGNVRELRNAMERTVLLSQGNALKADDFNLGRPSRPSQSSTYLVRLPENGCVLEEVERQLLAQALEYSGGNQTRAAQLLGITRDQVRYKMVKFEITAS